MADPEKEVNVADEDYNENEDDDFNPEAAAAEEELSSSDDDNQDTAATVKKGAKKAEKRKADTGEELDSGDEATIAERKRKRRKKDKEDAEESGGEGGLIKTRAQRFAEKAERKERRKAGTGNVTVDVDALWADLHRMPVGRPSPVVPKKQVAIQVHGDAAKENTKNRPPAPDDLIKIKRRVEFAGEITEIEEEVLRSSKEAQRYLAEYPEADPSNDSKQNQQKKDGLRRPLRRPSMFEPNPTAIVRGVPPDKLRHRAPSRVDVLMAEKKAAEEIKKKAEKMSTVQKTALDWKAFVADQGLSEELDEYGKSKKGFLAREGFLDRVHGAKEEARKAARLKG